MVWPASDVDTTQMDAGTDTPPRAEFLSWAQKFNQLRNHVSAYMQGLLSSADAAAARTALGATTTGSAVMTAADAAAARTAIAAAGTGVANTFTGPNTFTGNLTQQSASEGQLRAEKTGAGASLSILFNSETQIGFFDSVSGMLFVLDKASGVLSVPRAARFGSAGTAFGYAAGSGGTANQTTSKSSPVTIDRAVGRINSQNGESVAANGSFVFLVNNSTVGADDSVVINVFAAGWRAEVYNISAGSFRVRCTNLDGSAKTESVSMNFAVIKGSAS